MHETDVDAMVLTAGPNLRYFTGADWSMLERLTGAIVPQSGEPTFVVPAFEEPRLRMTVGDRAVIRAWQEDESPYELCTGVLTEWGVASGRVAVDQQAPYFVVDGLAKAAPRAELTTTTAVSARCRVSKSAAEIALIQHAMNVTLEVQRLAAESLREGAASSEVIDFLNAAHLAAGSDCGSTFAIVAFGESTAYPHGPESPQTLHEGDMVLVDTGCTFHGYHADLTRTYVFGKPTSRQREFW